MMTPTYTNMVSFPKQISFKDRKDGEDRAKVVEGVADSEYRVTTPSIVYSHDSLELSLRPMGITVPASVLVTRLTSICSCVCVFEAVDAIL